MRIASGIIYADCQFVDHEIFLQNITKRRGVNVFINHLAGRSTIQRGPQILLAVSIVPLCWLLMMLVHEFGHVLGAWATGGTVERVIWHPLAFSRTDVDPNPAPLIVVWAGPLLGGLLPFAAWVMMYRLPWAFVPRFFAGFCLIANGGYIGLGSFDSLGDCGPMLTHGTPMWVLWVFGAAYAAAGLCLWHRLGPKFGLGNEPEPVSRKLAVTVAVLMVLVVICGFLFGRSE